MSLVPNTTQVPHIIIRTWMRELSDTGLRVLLVIVDQTLGWEADPITHTRKKEDWIAYSQLKEKTSRGNTAVSNALRELESKGYIEITNGQGKRLKTKQERLGKKLFYRISTSPESGEDASNLSTKWNPQSGDTKETNTKTLPKGKEASSEKKTSCPLTNGSPLRNQYPNGHQECIEYLVDCETSRERKFINRGKQFMFLHKILSAGYGFDRMDRCITLIDKKYGKNNWDFATVASWLEKGI